MTFSTKDTRWARSSIFAGMPVPPPSSALLAELQQAYLDTEGDHAARDAELEGLAEGARLAAALGLA